MRMMTLSKHADLAVLLAARLGTRQVGLLACTCKEVRSMFNPVKVWTTDTRALAQRDEGIYCKYVVRWSGVYSDIQEFHSFEEDPFPTVETISIAYRQLLCVASLRFKMWIFKPTSMLSTEGNGIDWHAYSNLVHPCLIFSHPYLVMGEVGALIGRCYGLEHELGSLDIGGTGLERVPELHDSPCRMRVVRSRLEINFDGGDMPVEHTKLANDLAITFRPVEREYLLLLKHFRPDADQPWTTSPQIAERYFHEYHIPKVLKLKRTGGWPESDAHPPSFLPPS